MGAAGTHRVAQGGDLRPFTVPNAITLLRLACIPVFLWLLFAEDDRVAAGWLLAMLGATDWMDGWVARRFDQVSTLGKVFDPTVDRLLLLVAVIAITVDGSVPAWVALLALLREGLVSVAAIALAAMGARRMDVTWLGKTGTFMSMIAFPLFLAANSDLSWADEAEVAAWCFVLPGLAIGYWAAIAYIPLARQALAEGRAEHTGGPVS